MLLKQQSGRFKKYIGVAYYIYVTKTSEKTFNHQAFQEKVLGKANNFLLMRRRKDLLESLHADTQARLSFTRPP